MQKIEIRPEEIPAVLCENLSDDKTIFVFPTDTVMNSWIDWIVLNPDKSGMDAVAFERFCAWDTFKGKYVQEEKEGYSVIPPILRKFFVSDLIARNAAKPEKDRLQVIINPKDEYAKNADSFCDWIEKNLSSLNFWKKRLDQNATEYGELDAEDKDYLYIYEEYCKFLEDNKLFEPAWIEPESFNVKNRFVIFFPELLEDFCDFETLFSASPSITLCSIAKDVPAPKAYKYADSRSELRQTMLRIIDIAESGRADWSEIALSVPDIDTYRPYIEREFVLYNIPFVIKSGQPLTKNCAGRIFREIYDCHSNGFTFDSVRSLMLDECVPWKDEYAELRENLIREGNRMRCLCSPEEKDIWRQCFGSKTKRLELAGAGSEEIEYFEELQKFYNKIHKAVEDFFETTADGDGGFEKIRTSWMNFKTQFLKTNADFSEEANNILSRCIKELEAIISMEKKYADCNLQVSSPFDFFLRILDSKTYTPQTTATGVNIFKYKLSAAANFKYQFVIDASQKNIDVQYKRLRFLNTTKRTKLHLIDDDKIRNVTDIFVKLYAKKTDDTDCDENFVHFSYAEESFAGFMICHSTLTEDKHPELFDSLDYIKHERDFISGKITAAERITESQKAQFEKWKQTNVSKETSTSHTINEEIKNKIAARYQKESGLLRVSARGDLEKFFPCPRRWLLQSILKIHDDSLDTNLMQNFDMGNLHHKIFELFFKEYEGKKLPALDDENISEIRALIFDKVTEGIKSPSDFRDSILAISALESQKENICKTVTAVIFAILERFFGTTVEGIEKTFSKNAKLFEWYGKIDLLLKSDSGEYVIIDYKNSSYSIPKVSEMFSDKNDILADFQMPVYYKLIGGTSFEDFEDRVYGGYFCNIKEAKFTTVTQTGGSKNHTPEDCEETLRVIDDYGELFKDKVEAQAFEPCTSKDHRDKQNVKVYESCIACPCKTICRTTYTVAQRPLNTKAGGNK